MCVLLGLTNLQELSLDNTAITDEGMKHIMELRNLAYLSLSDTKYVAVLHYNSYMLHSLFTAE